MAPSQRPDNLSLQELEALLLAKRRQTTEHAVMRFASSEVALAQRSPGISERDVLLSRLRPPESWRGANGQDRYFRPVKLEPLDGVRIKRRALLAGAEGAPSAPARQLATVVIHDNGARTRRRWRDVLLLGIEIVALVGFVAILGSSYVRLRDLNRQARAMQQVTSAPVIAPPTMAPAATPIQILPGGRPEEMSQMPAPLSGLVKATVPLALPPTPGPQTPKRMVIAKIGVDAPVVSGDSWEDLKKGIGHRSDTANPGQVGNMVVSAHNDVYGEIFRDLDKLQSGDEVLVYTDGGAFRYIVNRVEIVAPTQVQVMDPTDYPALTMITCYPYLLDTHRVVAVADLAE